MLAREPNEEIFVLLWIFLCLYKHTVTTWILLSCIFVKLLIAKNGAIPSKVKLEVDLLPAVYALVSNVTNLFWFEKWNLDLRCYDHLKKKSFMKWSDHKTLLYHPFYTSESLQNKRNTHQAAVSHYLLSQHAPANELNYGYQSRYCTTGKCSKITEMHIASPAGKILIIQFCGDN